MRKFYFTVHLFLTAVKRYILLLTFLVCSSMCIQAQQVTFFESFDNTEPGTVPDGWKIWQSGGGSPSAATWTVFKNDFFGSEKFIMSIEEPGREGMRDEDWLITPQITPVAGDMLMFNNRRGYDEKGDEFHVLISTTTDEVPAAFTHTLVAYTEESMPELMDPINGKRRLDLSAYAGIPIYIAFVHIGNVGPDNVSNFWVIDEVEVRPIQEAYVVDTYLRQATSPPQPPIKLGDLAFAGTIEFIVNGDEGTADVTSMTFTTNGTTDPSLIKEVKVYYTHYEPVVQQDIIDGLVPLFGSIETPGETFEITGNIEMELGVTPFFWILYTFDETRELTFPYPQVDVTFEKYVVNGVEYIPAVNSYFGAIDVVPATVANDHFADAIELTPTTARYGSSTYPATYEPDYDALAYCHTTDIETVHSVWWHFTAPSTGWITADLSESRFNTILTFFNEDMEQLACNDNISDTKQQSRIAGFSVEEGQKIYVRVSDFGGWGGTAYHNSGVVVMDFSFTTPLGVEQENNLLNVSMPYPNPAAAEVHLDLNLHKPDNITTKVRDMMGRETLIQQMDFPAGQHAITFDASALPPGAYIIQVNGHTTRASRKLVITR